MSDVVVNASSSKKLGVKDYIYAGAFAAVYLIAVLAVIMVFGSIPLLYLLCPLTLGVFCGSIYFLAVLKVRKFGVALIISALFACISTGFEPIAFGICIVTALLAEICMLIGKYESKFWYIISYTVFNIGTAANFFRIIYAKDAYIEGVRRMGDEYADKMSKLLAPSWIGFGIIGLAVLGGLIGGFLGTKFVKKHFEKAGVV
ncbi:MAG: MptD family putative ECF transporter S component [Lachnospiraceae bacterium]|nr:MptD family putative ECF transporter S component [Lachnospiraceae bacterium]